MSTFTKFEEIEAWQKARKLADEIFQEVSKGVYDQDKRLLFQMLGSSGSVMENIAEGHGRGGNKEFVQFLWIAKGSSAELRSQLYRSFDRTWINMGEFEVLYKKAEEIEKMLQGLVNHLNKTSHKGVKFR